MIIYDDDGIGHDVVPRKVIDDIKAEIKERLWEDDAERVCEIINKHIGERSE